MAHNRLCRPSWTKPFIEEPAPKDPDADINTTGGRHVAWLIVLCLTGLGLQTVSAVVAIQYITLAILWGLLVLYSLAVQPRTVSITAIAFALAIASTQAGLLYSKPHEELSTLHATMAGLSLTNALIVFVVLLNMPFRDPRLSRAGISKAFSKPDDSYRSPEDNITLWQWMSVSWMAPMLAIGKKRKLEPEDVWRLPYDFQHAYLHDAFRSLKGGIVWRLFCANWQDLVILCILSLIELASDYSTPLILQYFLRAMEQVPVTKTPALFFVALNFIVRYVSSQTSVISLWYSRRAYERSRGEMITMIHEKTLQRKVISGVDQDEKPKDDQPDGVTPNEGQLPTTEPQIHSEEHEPLLNGQAKTEPGPASKFWARIRHVLGKISLRKSKVAKPEKQKPASMGKILNMMRNDVYEVSQRFWEFSDLISEPIGVIFSFALLYRLLGWSCLIGVGVMVVVQGLLAILAKVLVIWETKRRKATDTKLQQVSQYIEAIRHLRYYAWHEKWLGNIMESRQKELNLRIITKLWNAAIYFISEVGDGVLPVAAFWAYTEIQGSHLTVDVAFPALELFSMLQNNLRMLPRLITTLTNAYVAVGRIEDFMAEPDKEDSETKDLHFGEEFEIRKATFAWPGTASPVLKDISLTFPSGVTLIYGQVAAGKSALLQALLGELDMQSGELVRPSTAVAYCSQTPWLQSMSIRDNILFGNPYDEARYKASLHACALIQDLAAFQHGDLSPIGENGIGLSGGQKMRVALARAVYSRADTLLLDDPLSALDQQTAELIVHECLQGKLLLGRTVILVTHRIYLCVGIAEQVVELANGHATIHDRNEMMKQELLSPVTSRVDGPEGKDDKKDDEAAAVPDKFEDEEHRADGGVQAKVYWEYIRAGSIVWWVFVLTSAAFVRVFNLGSSWFLKEWSEAYNDTVLRSFSVQHQYTILDNPSTPISRFFDRFSNPSTNAAPWLVGLLVLVLLEAIAYLAAMIFAMVVTYKAGKNLFREVMGKVSSTTFRFYDVTPVGRLMNRLTSDMGMVDGGVTNVLLYVLFSLVAWLGTLLVIASVTPSFLLAIGVLTGLYIYTILLFIPTSQSLRRMEMVSLSPLMSNFGALLEGLMTVRAFCVQSQFQDRIIKTTDAFQQMDHFYWSLQAWLMFRFDLLSASAVVVLTLIAIFSGLTAGLTAFTLVAARRLVSATHGLCRSYGKLQLEFVAVERVIELLHLDQEEPGDQLPPASWPSTKDDIVFEDVTMRYAPHLEPALSDVSFCITGGSNTALIGRTGSGKSTLALSLLATTAPTSGRILIGGIDISKVDKRALRSRITFLAQEPVLFPGSLRHNLDPVEEHTDVECLSVIERVCGTYGFTLETEVDTGGKNLSQGQRQLIGLARAILRRSAIVIMDEATASIDRETAWEIQRVLREELAGSTVITIAHRSSAVRGADLCIKLADGKLEAIGRPEDIVPGDAGTSGGASRDAA